MASFYGPIYGRNTTGHTGYILSYYLLKRDSRLYFELQLEAYNMKGGQLGSG